VKNTLEAARQEFLLAKYLEGLSPRTVDIYEEIIGRFISFAGSTLDLSDLKAPLIRQYLASLTSCNEVTKGIHVKCLRAFCRWLVANEYLEKNHMDKIPSPKEPQTFPRVLSEEELRALLKVARPSPRDYSIVALLVDCGLRSTELCRLELDGLDLRGRSVTVKSGKGGKGRLVFLSDLTARAISRWLSVRPDVFCNALFTSSRKEALTRSGLQQILSRLKNRTGIENGKRVSPSVLRASCATCFVKNGGDPHSLARLLGHSSTRMAERYVNLLADDVKEIHRRCSPVSRLEGRRER